MISAEARMSVVLHPSMLSVGSLANAKQCVNQGKEARGNQMSFIGGSFQEISQEAKYLLVVWVQKINK